MRKVGNGLREVLGVPEVKKQLAARGGYPLPMSPEEVVAFVQNQQRTWNPLLQQFASQSK